MAAAAHAGRLLWSASPTTEAADEARERSNVLRMAFGESSTPTCMMALI